MTPYFPDEKSLATVLRYRVVIDEIVVDAKKIQQFNEQIKKPHELRQCVESFLETSDNKFKDWEFGSPMLMADCRNFVGEFGEGYVAFKGDVTSATDDLFPADQASWSQGCLEPIPFASNDYFEKLE
ncbi:MAG: hypothetical protein EBY40_06955 [Marivivens sp.]|nr:hypothetical protein [Marivivens sp.]NBT51521.1 hypothetical protein [Marivivens sp.]NCW68766.1 hypothetical protein [Marivivens sp.]NDH02851.1 hypothetical protein [Marivivens sp.]